MNVLDLFIIEPRAGYYQCSKSWLVVKDKTTGEYLTEGPNKKMITFQNSEDVVKYLKGKGII